MESLAHQRCFHHSRREAAARCPECGRFFCRECVTEHDDRVICARCLRKLVRRPLTERLRLAGIVRIAQCLLGVLIVWLFFYCLGRALLSLPADFHEGTLWRASWWEVE